MNRSDVQYIGTLSKLHGFKGAYVLISDSYVSQEIENWESVFLEYEGLLVPFFIDKASLNTDNSALISFDDITTEERAKMFLNCKVYQENAILGDVENPHSLDVNGYTVIDKQKGTIGPVQQVHDYNENIVLGVLFNQKEVLIPAAEGILLKVDHKRRIIHVKLPDGLLEIND